MRGCCYGGLHERMCKTKRFKESVDFKIKDARIHELEIGADIYYWLENEDFEMKSNHIGMIDDYYTNGSRTIITVFDGDVDLMYSVLEFNARNDMIASESFKDSHSAKKFFKEII